MSTIKQRVRNCYISAARPPLRDSVRVVSVKVVVEVCVTHGGASGCLWRDGAWKPCGCRWHPRTPNGYATQKSTRGMCILLAPLPLAPRSDRIFAHPAPRGERGFAQCAQSGAGGVGGEVRWAHLGRLGIHFMFAGRTVGDATAKFLGTLVACSGR